MGPGILDPWNVSEPGEFTLRVTTEVESRSNNLTSTTKMDNENISASSISDKSSLLIGIATLAAELAMVFGGIVPYIPQYLNIKRTHNTKGFSLYVCLALIVANTLRILFWFGRHFETPLLIQSVLMNLTMLELVRLCVNVNNKSDRLLQKDPTKKEERIFIDFDLKYFWQWTDFQSYVEALMTFLAIGCVVMFFFLHVEPFVEAVGFLAVFTEALLGTPQFYRNMKNKSTFGMSVPMVLMWTSGDVFKTSYFVLRSSPVQFVVCGALQVCVDLAILSQVWLYRANTVKMKKGDLSMHY